MSDRNYLVIGNGVRKDGSAYSKCAPIVNGSFGEFIGDEKTYVNDILPVGKIIKVAQVVSTAEN